jgi:hypothetical protein
MSGIPGNTHRSLLPLLFLSGLLVSISILCGTQTRKRFGCYGVDRRENKGCAFNTHKAKMSKRGPKKIRSSYLKF